MVNLESSTEFRYKCSVCVYVLCVFVELLTPFFLFPLFSRTGASLPLPTPTPSSTVQRSTNESSPYLSP